MNCQKCNKEISRNSRTGYCMNCYHETHRGEKAPNWQGGTTPYKIIRINGREVLEHRYIYEQAYGPLSEGWVVHHLNGDRKDNRLENLVALPQGRHYSAHGVQAQYGQSGNLRRLEALYRVESCK